ncbi:YtcA family lipoprotein [Escherichia coli]|uniref:Uncharacterized protein YtcA n=1 Tax=Escherichia coli TaxID=562 RepID=A0A6D0DFT9_ECOLX|nr:YtcA family lipoprotein [Escherichia coli]EFA2317598.1 hypothetical protein [Escherichia coli]EIK3121318.1 hypothetical protein [Escherichia coli]EJV4895138.1 hypothetical protein [Escherichia coli]MBA8195535.1 hypothetical protein [Escherichia coli]MBA8247994.1 hypothetical protein [Escherichia coli]
MGRFICFLDGVVLLPLFFLSGCTISPAIPVIGAYYPGWLFCIIGGVILTLISRHILIRTNSTPYLAYPGVVYTALFVLFSMLLWLAFF